jgi:spermidine/putrescine transport system ATP-binding protein
MRELINNNIIEIKNVSKFFGDEQALDNVSLNISNGEFVTLLGPSGCGKTTLLRIISGLETPTSGKIFINGKDVTFLSPEERHLNMVFQNYALFPHMTVFDNIAFGLRCKHVTESEVIERVEKVLEIVKLQKYVKRKPDQLSGGQQQRVAIARAVVNEPLVLLLDEPLSALDYNLRKSMQIELKQLQRRLGITFIFVTHDQEEALSMSDRVAVMNEGLVEQFGTPKDIYEEPHNLYVADFIGEANIFSTQVTFADQKSIKINLEGKMLELTNKKKFKEGDAVHIVVRPEDIRVWSQDEVLDTTDMLPASVEQAIYKGSTVDLIVMLQSGRKISATQFFNEDDDKLEYYNNEKVWIEWVPGWEVILPNENK